MKYSLRLPACFSSLEQSVFKRKKKEYNKAPYGTCRLEVKHARPRAQWNLLLLDFPLWSCITDHNEQAEWVCSSMLSSGVYTGVACLTDLHLSARRINCENRMKQKQANLHSKSTVLREPPLFVASCPCLMVCKSRCCDLNNPPLSAASVHTSSL